MERPGEASQPREDYDLVLASYVDSLLDGEELEPEAIRAAHPDFADRLVEDLLAFIDPDSSEASDSGPPLGTLGDYTLLEQIGRGGMGVVYRAWENSMDRPVALKVLPSGVAADEKAVARFVREAQLAGRLHHANVVSVYGMGVKEQTPYYAMEFVEGETLSQVLARIRQTPADVETVFGKRDSVVYFGKLAEAFAEVAEGLQHAHSKGIVHRDIKPSNLILDRAGRLRILDFGLARIEGQDTLTVSGDVLGTPLYMSPEQARQKRISVDHRTDVYSLGASLYEVLTGQPPFRGRDRADTITQIVERDAVDPTRRNPRVPKDLETIVLKCLRKTPGERYGTAEALAQDLARFVRGEPIEAKPEGAWLRFARRMRRHRTRTIVTATILVAIGLVAWLAISRREAEHAREAALYPGKLRAAVGKLDSGAWVLRKASPPLYAPGIDIRVFEPDDFRDVLELAGKGTVEEAIAELQELTQSSPWEPEAHYHLGRAYAVMDRRELARVALEKALDVDPSFVAAEALRERLAGRRFEATAISSSGVESQQRWIALRASADRLRYRGEHEQVEEVLTELIHRYGEGEPPYTGFLTECYLARASTRLAIGQHDLAEEDCVRARGTNSASLASELLLGKVYLSAGKPDLAHQAFDRLRSRSEILDVLPFWVVSVHLSVPESDVSGALEWARSVRDVALRERLLTYLYLRLARWQDAVKAGRRAVEADPGGLVPHQLLLAAQIQHVLHGGEESAASVLELAEACREAIALDPANRRSRYLVRAGWEALAHRQGSPVLAKDDMQSARQILLSAARKASIELPAGDRDGSVTDDFSRDSDLQDGEPFRWRVIDECCPGEVESTSDGLRVTKLNPDRGHDAWLVTEEVYSGDVLVLLRADPGTDKVSCNLHVDLGTASLYYASVWRSGRVEIGRIDYGEKRAEVEGDVGPLTGDVFLELRSRGDRVESRVWREGAERPDESTLGMIDPFLRLGSIGMSTNARPAYFRWLRVKPASP